MEGARAMKKGVCLLALGLAELAQFAHNHEAILGRLGIHVGLHLRDHIEPVVLVLFI